MVIKKDKDKHIDECLTSADMKTPGPSLLPTTLRPRPLPGFLTRVTVMSLCCTAGVIRSRQV